MSIKLKTINNFGGSGSGGSGTTNYADLTNKPKINGVTLSGNKTAADLNLKTYMPFPNDFVTDGTLQEVADSMVNSSGAIEGTAYLGGISGSCMPWPGGGNAECKVEFMSNGLAVITLSSSNVAPYRWEYNTASGDYTWKKSIMQFETMPSANSLTINTIVQYIGTTTANYTNGYFYKCVQSSGSYVWQQLNIQPTATEHQVSQLPTADYTQVNKVYQFIGDTVVGGYTKGYFYVCEQTIESFVVTQTSGTSVGTITTDVDEFKVAMGASLATGTYTFVATGTAGQMATGWTLNGTAISNINDYGIYFSGIALTGTTITATYTAGSYNWVQLNVQPGGGSSRTTITDTTSTTPSISVESGKDYIYTQNLASLSVTGTSGNMMNEATITFTTGSNPSVSIDSSITRMGAPVTFEPNKTYVISFWNGFYIVGVEG